MKTLKQIAQEWLEEKVADGYESQEQAGNELLHHGCQSGLVGGLIYYSDTCQFYHDHKEEIDALLYETLESTGLSVSELFGEKWSNDDPLALEQYNQNLLAWFGFEKTVRQIVEEE
jgi:hypothetical protein